jgi:1-deoxy-D-xylulose-5-phosphate synthase
MLEALVRKGPTVIRYPRGAAPEKVEAVSSVAEDGRARFAIWATGDWLGKANEVARLVGGCEVTFARYLKPFDSATLERQRKAGMTIVSLENGSVAGGFGESIGADVKFGWPDEFIPHGSQAELEKKYGLDAASIADALRRRVR